MILSPAPQVARIAASTPQVEDPHEIWLTQSDRSTVEKFLFLAYVRG